MLEIKKIKPMGSQVLVSKNLYDEDDYNKGGILVHKMGDIKQYQTIVAVGDDVKYVKPGDIVSINFFKYAVFKEDHNSIRADKDDNPIIGLRLNEVELNTDNGEKITCFLIDFRDIEYVITDCEEIKYERKKIIEVDPPKKKLILPYNKIKV